MSPDDEKRLAEIRRRNELCVGESHYGVTFLLAKLAESERARTEAEATIQRMRDVFAREHDVRIAAENALAESRASRIRIEERAIALMSALTEERTKREEAERFERAYEGNWKDAIASAEAAEARLAELEYKYETPDSWY